MELILLIIYSTIVWFIFFKKKWLPWNITSQVIVVTIPVICLAIIILFMNIVAPSAGEVRAMNYVIPISPRVTGRSPKCRSSRTGRSRRAMCSSRSTRCPSRRPRKPPRPRLRGLGDQLKNTAAKKAALEPADRPGEKARRTIHRARLDRRREDGPTSNRRKAISEIWKVNSSPPTPRNRRPKRRSPRPNGPLECEIRPRGHHASSRRPTAAWRISRCVPACGPRSLRPGR